MEFSLLKNKNMYNYIPKKFESQFIPKNNFNR
jgi:hypothetical protein